MKIEINIENIEHLGGMHKYAARLFDLTDVDEAKGKHASFKIVVGNTPQSVIEQACAGIQERSKVHLPSE